MQITRENLNEIIFENQDAKLLIEDVILHTSANLYYYHCGEITVQAALKIWNKVRRAEEGGQTAAMLPLKIGQGKPYVRKVS